MKMEERRLRKKGEMKEIQVTQTTQYKEGRRS